MQDPDLRACKPVADSEHPPSTPCIHKVRADSLRDALCQIASSSHCPEIVAMACMAAVRADNATLDSL